MKILVTGPQGSGKTTQGKLLADFLGVPLISMGEILRAEAERNTPKGVEIKQALERGQMVDDNVVADLLNKEVAKSPTGFVMDGYPRSLDQIKLFDPKFDMVFYLDVPNQMVLTRMKKRGRADDTDELIQKRLDLYHSLTQPVLQHYTNLGILHKIVNLGSVEEIQTDLRQKVKNG